MFLLHRIGPRINSNFNTMTEILESEGPLSFDGIYEEVLFNHDQLIGRDITLFVMGAYVGKNNSFDVGQPFGKYLTWNEIRFLQGRLNAKLGYHGFWHKDLTTLDDTEVLHEITPPFPMDFFAYPYGAVDKRIANLVEQVGYKEAWAAGPYGDGSQFQRKRRYINW